MVKAKSAPRVKGASKVSSSRNGKKTTKGKTDTAKVKTPTRGKIAAKKKSPGRSKAADRKPVETRTRFMSAAAQPGPLPVAGSFESVTIRTPFGVDAQPGEMVPAALVADGAVSPHNATVQGQAIDTATGLPGGIVMTNGAGGNWTLVGFTKNGGGPLDPNTEYTLEVQIAGGGDSHSITIRTLP
jgi:hypothetical protein